MSVVTLLLAFALTAIAASSAAAAPYLYWTAEGGTLGRVGTDGRNPQPAFVTGASGPIGPSLDGQHLYWANTAANSIARANLDGTNVSQSLVTGAAGPLGTAVNSRGLYWINPGADQIGRADLDGGNALQNWFARPANTKGMAIDGTWIYWAGGGVIGRAQLDGGTATSTFVPGVANPEEIAVDDRFIYWTDPVAGTIGRAQLNGDGAESDFISGLGSPSGLALDGTYLYWSDESGNAIGRANLDGSNLRPSYVSPVASPTGLAVSLPVVTSSVAGLDFPEQALGTFGAPQRITFSNTGQNLLLPTRTRLLGDHSAFLVSYDGCTGASIAPGRSCDVDVRFGPSASGAHTAYLQLLSNAHPQSPATIGLRGSGGTLPVGPQGERGGAGPTGSQGPAGPPGPSGPRGATGNVRVVACRPVKVTVGKGKARKRVERTRCTVSIVTTPGSFTAASTTRAVSARLTSARGALVARASGNPRGGRLTLELMANRRLAHGRYRLAVTTRSGAERTSSARWVTVR